MAAKGKREKMDFEFLDDDDGMKEEDRVPDYIASMKEWMRNRPPGFGVGKVLTSLVTAASADIL
jgi:hypothetical protein